MTGGSVLDSLSIPIMIVLYCFYLILNQSARVKKYQDVQYNYSALELLSQKLNNNQKHTKKNLKILILM